MKFEFWLRALYYASNLFFRIAGEKAERELIRGQSSLSRICITILAPTAQTIQSFSLASKRK